MNAVHSVFDDSRLHGCRFHLGQSWWTLGLSEDYKAKGTPISEWLLLFFGLSLLSPDDVITAFTEEIMPSMPTDDRCQRFADYVVDNYIDDGCDFPVSIWAQSLDLNPTTTNESLHDHLNADINTPHPNIYIFVQTLLRQQATTYISIGSLDFTRAIIKSNQALLLQLFTEYKQGTLTLKQYVKRVAYRVAPYN